MGYLSTGDLICVEGDAAFGRLAVSTMMETYKKLFSDLTGDKGYDFNAQFTAPVRAVKDAFDKLGDPWPFSPKKCSMKELGKKAEELTAAMLKFAGKFVPTTAKEPEGALSKFGSGVAGISQTILYGALIIGGVMLLPRILPPKPRQNPRRRRR